MSYLVFENPLYEKRKNQTKSEYQKQYNKRYRKTVRGKRKTKKSQAKYVVSEKGKANFHRYNISKKGMKTKRKWISKNLERVKKSKDKWALKNKEKTNEESRKYGARIRAELKAFLGNKCVKCGYDKDQRALQIDHINGGGSQEVKTMGGTVMRMKFYNNNRALARKNLQILCANCNWIKRYENKEIYKWKGDVI